MTELVPRLPCPVCLGVMMDKVTVGTEQPVEIDLCRRCDGIWLERGEVQHLRRHPQQLVMSHIAERTRAQVSQCHDCHAPLDRDAEQCAACGHPNRLQCPHCDRTMQVTWYKLLRLDICTRCQGTWFDHHELQMLWSSHFDAALRRRHLASDGTAIHAVALGEEVLFHTIFFSPELLVHGSAAAGAMLDAAGAVIVQMPEAVASTPEAASVAVEVVTEAAESVFEAVLAVVSGIFG